MSGYSVDFQKIVHDLQKETKGTSKKNKQENLPFEEKRSELRRTHDVLRGADLLGQLAALHGAEVHVLAEEFSVQDVPHGVLKTPSVTVHHSKQRKERGSDVC